MNVDELEDVKWPQKKASLAALRKNLSVDIMFHLEDNTMAIDFDLGDEDPVESGGR